MNRLFIVFLTIISLSCISSACMSELALYSSGVVFNNMEKFQPNLLENMGTQAEHYIKKCINVESDSLAKNIVLVTPAMKIHISQDPVDIKNVQRIRNNLVVTVSYGGGCETHDFELYAFTNLLESNPPTARFRLSHNAHEDRCKALITETISFNLAPFDSLFSFSAPLNISLNMPDGTTQITFPWYSVGTCSYVYRSHFFREAMVTLDYLAKASEPSYFPRMSITVDSTIKFVKPFDYGTAISTELEWLVKTNILSGISQDKIDQIAPLFKGHQGQYWTLQDSVLGYNAWYTNNIASDGSYTWGAPLAVKSRCGLDVEYALPPDEIGKQVTKCILQKGKYNVTHLFSTHLSGKKLYYSLSVLPSKNARLEIVDSQGRQVVSFRLLSGNKNAIKTLPNSLTKGVYHIVFRDQNISQVNTISVAQ